ncbi:MAG: hypothetical protein E6Y37_17225, partial [Enterobacter hormaechei]|nr:hypothetical protein [Enterobacter hormaechei]
NRIISRSSDPAFKADKVISFSLSGKKNHYYLTEGKIQCVAGTEKQKPSHRLGSLNSGARTRNGFCFVIALIRMVFILFHKR